MVGSETRGRDNRFVEPRSTKPRSTAGHALHGAKPSSRADCGKIDGLGAVAVTINMPVTRTLDEANFSVVTYSCAIIGLMHGSERMSMADNPKKHTAL